MAAVPSVVHAADWSDTSLSLRYGTTFAEPFDNNADGSRKDIKKAILALTNVTGYKYGSTFINVDFLQSDHNDPGGGVAGNPGAQEVYAVFRHTLDIGKVTGKELKFGAMRGLGLTAGLDLNTKNDGYASKKRMFVDRADGDVRRARLPERVGAAVRREQRAERPGLALPLQDARRTRGPSR
jgi:hypothetical protein